MRLTALHRTMALVFALPLLVSTVTGLTYRVGRYWFGMSKETGGIVLSIHEGSYLGEMLTPVYVLLVGLGGVILLGTGVWLLTRRMPPLPPSPRRSQVRLHRTLALIFALPFFLTTMTGMMFRICQAWFGWTKQDAKFLMDLHQGTWLGTDLRAYYVLVVGLGILSVLFTGLSLINPPASARPSREQA